MPERSRALRIGTRRSPLALYQTRLVAHEIATAHGDGLDVELVEMTTTGDRHMGEFRDVGERGIFAKELEQALLAGEIDCAVHSLKDLRLELPTGLVLAAILPREDPRDALCGAYTSLAELPPDARVATSSVRRAAALRAARADIVPVPIRGNVQTRLQTASARGDHACMLAAAGLRRLGLQDRIGCLLPVDEFVPEAGQGAIAVQVRDDVDDFAWHALDDEPTRWCVEVERRVAAALGGGCEAPVGVHVGVGPDGIAQGHVFTAHDDGARSGRASSTIDRGLSASEAATLLLGAARQAGLEPLVQ